MKFAAAVFGRLEMHRSTCADGGPSARIADLL